MDPQAVSALRDALLDVVEEILKGNPGVCRLAMKHRAKFEGYLKFSLAAAVESGRAESLSFEDLERLVGTTRPRKMVDLELRSGDVRCYVELKTCNTSGARDDECEKHTRPMTKNIEGVIDDRDALRLIVNGTDSLGLVLSIVFPVATARMKAFEKYHSARTGPSGKGSVQYHVNRIIGERDSELGYRMVDGLMAGYGILIFCLPVAP